jgi:hypothetical protein
MARYGPVQRRIRTALLGNPGREFYTSELARYAYPLHQDEPTRHQRRAIVRAADIVAHRIRRDWPGGVVWVGK